MAIASPGSRYGSTLQRLEQLLAEGVEVEPFDSAQGPPLEFCPPYPEPRLGGARVVHGRVPLGVLRIHPQSHRHSSPLLFPERPEALQLGERVEHQVVRDGKELPDILLLEGSGEAVHLAAELLAAQLRLPRGAGTDAVKGLPDEGEDAPHGEGLERHQDLGTAAPLDIVQYGEIMAQPPQVHHISGGRGELQDFVDVDTGQFKTFKAIKHGSNLI